MKYIIVTDILDNVNKKKGIGETQKARPMDLHLGTFGSVLTANAFSIAYMQLDYFGDREILFI